MYYKGYIAIDKNLYQENKNFLDLYLLRNHVHNSITSKSHLSPIGMWQESKKWMLLPFEAENPDAKQNDVTSDAYTEIYHSPLEILRNDPYGGHHNFEELCLSNIGKVWLKYLEYDASHLWLVQGRVDNAYDDSPMLSSGEVRELIPSNKNVIEYGVATGYNLNDNNNWNEFIDLISDYLNSIDHDNLDIDDFVNYVINYARNISEDGYILDSDIDLQDLLNEFKYSA